MTALTIISSQLTGSALTPEAANAAGNSFANSDGTVNVVLNNTGVDPCTVTFNGNNRACNFGKTSHTHDEVVVVAPGELKIMGPFEPQRFNDESGNVNFTYDQVIDVTVYACRYS